MSKSAIIKLSAAVVLLAATGFSLEATTCKQIEDKCVNQPSTKVTEAMGCGSFEILCKEQIKPITDPAACINNTGKPSLTSECYNKCMDYGNKAKWTLKTMEKCYSGCTFSGEYCAANVPITE